MTPFNKDNHIIAIQKLMEREQRGESINALRNHYIDANTINLDLDAPLYRIMQFERLFDVLSKRELSMVHPQRWDDPYEVFLMRSYGTTSEGEKVEFEPIKDSLYGLCFSLNPECDGLWRSFSNQSCTNCTQEKWSIRHGKQPITVKIKTTGRKLMDAFYDISVRFHSLSFWIGMVDYCNAEQISNVINDGINHITDDTGVDLIKTLLIKRMPFKYEQEVRLLYHKCDDSTTYKVPSDFFYFNVDPNKLIDEIISVPLKLGRVKY